jgi:hypothetical protein
MYLREKQRHPGEITTEEFERTAEVLKKQQRNLNRTEASKRT